MVDWCYGPGQEQVRQLSVINCTHHFGTLIFNLENLVAIYIIQLSSLNSLLSQAEINNRINVDPTLDTNFGLSADSRNDNSVLRWYNTGFQRCTNTGNQHIFYAGCQHF